MAKDRSAPGPVRLSNARRPQRTRGKERFAHLLDVTETLLADHTNSDVTLATIAERAEVPLPSVYHFFPNRNAIFVELARRFHEDLAALSRTEVTPSPPRWQDLLLIRQRRGRDYLNAHPAALQLFMGAGVSAEVRTLDLRGNSSLARLRATEEEVTEVVEMAAYMGGGPSIAYGAKALEAFAQFKAQQDCDSVS